MDNRGRPLRGCTGGSRGAKGCRMLLIYAIVGWVSLCSSSPVFGKAGQSYTC